MRLSSQTMRLTPKHRNELRFQQNSPTKPHINNNSLVTGVFKLSSLIFNVFEGFSKIDDFRYKAQIVLKHYAIVLYFPYLDPE